MAGGGSSVPYRLRPNKAVDRELFLALLSRLGAALSIEGHRYIGLGGPFLEDFRLVHARLGISRMVCVEVEAAVHQRQKFNRPVDCIECVHSTLDDFIDRSEFQEEPVVLWLDYTDPKQIAQQIDRFARTLAVVPLRSVVRVTLNAQPSSLGIPSGNKAGEDLQQWRLEQFRARMGTHFPSHLKPDDMKFQNFGRSVLLATKLAVEREALSHPDRDVVWALATHYADGQPMVTATLLVVEAGEKELHAVVEGWEFRSTPEAPHILDMPALSTLERLTMEAVTDPKGHLGFDLPVSDMKQDPYEAFKKFYRLYPHFSRIEL